MFKLDERLENDTFFIDDLDISKLYLMNNANFPWLILVPKKNDLVELIDLNFDDQTKLLREINLISQILKKKYSPDKINIATLGNIVSQLHIHIIARFKNDIAFPKPVWGFEAKNYQESEKNLLISEIKNLLRQ
jgi:diadenosine tetraphosphate (Ap4A) HIT family hydrolase